jgi:hypothetical protein
MDAFIVSELVRKSLQSNKKNLEHAAFIINSPSKPVTSLPKPQINGYSTNKSNNFKAMDLSDRSITTAVVDDSVDLDVDNSIVIDDSTSINNSESNKLSDNSDNYKITDNTDNSALAYSTTDNSITVNNIKVTNIKGSSKEDVNITDLNMSNDIDMNEDDESEYIINNKANKISSVTFLLMLLINSYAAYLSWECNSNKGYPLALKIVFSFFAFIFGTMYLLYYILFRFDDCNKFNNLI